MLKSNLELLLQSRDKIVFIFLPESPLSSDDQIYKGENGGDFAVLKRLPDILVRKVVKDT